MSLTLGTPYLIEVLLVCFFSERISNAYKTGNHKALIYTKLLLF